MDGWRHHKRIRRRPSRPKISNGGEMDALMLPIEVVRSLGVKKELEVLSI
jgi:hypothetical protein